MTMLWISILNNFCTLYSVDLQFPSGQAHFAHLNPARLNWFPQSRPANGLEASSALLWPLPPPVKIRNIAGHNGRAKYGENVGTRQTSSRMGNYLCARSQKRRKSSTTCNEISIMVEMWKGIEEGCISCQVWYQIMTRLNCVQLDRKMTWIQYLELSTWKVHQLKGLYKSY